MKKKLQKSLSKHRLQGSGSIGKGVLTTGLGLAETALDGLPIPGAKAAVVSLLQVIEGIDKTSDNAETMNSIKTHLLRLVDSILDPLSERRVSDIPPDLKEAVETLTADLRRFTVELQEASSKGWATRFLRRDDDSKNLPVISQRIREALDRFQTRGMIRLEMIGNTAKEDMDGVKDDVVDLKAQITRDQEQWLLRERARLVDGLPRAEKAGYLSGRPDAPTVCFEGTRIGVLQDIRTWVHNITSDVERLYWLHGMAGLGKSTIAQTVAEEAAKEGYLGGSFFCSRQEASLRDPALVFPTLAYQLALFNAEIGSRIGEALETHRNAGHESRQSQLNKLILEPLASTSSVPQPVLVVLDAVDECEASGASEILRLLLVAASTKSFPLKVLITSRPEAHIRSAFKSTQKYQKAILHDVERSIVRRDIEVYLRAGLDRLPSQLELSLEEGWVRPEDLKALVDLAGVLFVLAATALRFIGDDKVCDPQSQLAILTAVRMLSSNARPYARLDELYLQVLRNTVSEVNIPEVLARFQKVVGSIVLLRDPLSLRALERLVGLDRGKARSALYQLHSIIITPATDDEAPRIYHPSFLDFVTSGTRCTDPSFMVKRGEHEGRLALRCLQIMTSMLKKGMVGNNDPSVLNSEIDNLDEKIGKVIPLELQYACLYWASHLSQADPVDTALVEQLDDFAARCLLCWVEAMSLLGKAHVAVSSANEAYSCAASTPRLSHLAEIMNDTHRFLLAHFDAIKSSAIHTYQSALPFTPKETVLYKTYGGETKTSVRALQGLAPAWSSCLMTMARHSGRVTSVALSPDSTRIASGSEDNIVYLWDVVSGAHVMTLKGHASGVTSVAFSPDGSRLVSGSYDRTLRVWDPSSGELVSTYEVDYISIFWIAFPPDGLRVATQTSRGRDNIIHVQDGVSGTTLFTLKGHSGQVTCIAFSPDNSRLVSGAWDRSVRLWDVVLGIHLTTLGDHVEFVQCVSFSPDSARIASGSFDGVVHLWDTRSGERLHTLQHSRPVASVAFSPNGLHLLAASGMSINLWNTHSGELISTLAAHFQIVNSVAYTPNSLHIVSGADDYTVRLWETAPSITQTNSIEKHSSVVSCAALSPDGSRLVSGSEDSTVRLWDAITGASLATLEGHADMVNSVAFSPDSLRLASGSSDNSVRLWDAITATPISTLTGHSSWATSVFFSPDGSRLVSGSEDRTLRLWNPMTGARIRTLKGDFERITCVVYSPDSSRLAAGMWYRSIRLWDAVSGKLVVTVEHDMNATSLAFSSDSTRLATGYMDPRVCLWDAVTGSLIATLEGHSDPVHSVAFSFGNSRLISRSDKDTLVWDEGHLSGHSTSSERPTMRIVTGAGANPSSSPRTLVKPGRTVELAIHEQWLVASTGLNDWIRLCRVPSEYSLQNSSKRLIVYGKRVALACGGGQVLVLDLSDVILDA